MKLRTFLAKDMKEALASVRAEMGPEAVIVGSERAKGGGVMVRAAVDQPNTDQADTAEPQSHETAANDSFAPQDFEARYREGLVRRLRGPQPVKRDARNFNRAGLLTLLGAHRAPDALSHELAEAAEKSRLSDMTLALAFALDKRMRIAPIDVTKANAIMLAGPNGAGKTAVAAKIAAHARLAGRAVTLIAADPEGAGAVARLETFASHLGAKTVVAQNAQVLADAIAGAIGEKTLAVVDTAGFDPRGGKARAAFSALAKIDGVEAIGVVSASGDAEEISEIASALGTFTNRVVVTGLDLTHRLGALAAAATQGAALAHITRSPFVAGGLETLTPISLARALVEAGTGNADSGSSQ